MKIGIISDTHDQAGRASRAVAALIRAGADVLVHCGDITGPEVVEVCGGLPSYFVFGNNDFDKDALRRAIVEVGGACLERGGSFELDGRKIAVAHGDLPREIRRLLAADPDYFLYGHSHLAADERRGLVRWINPGALHRAPRWTVALLDLRSGALEFLPVADRD